MATVPVKSTVKVEIGAERSMFFPITAEPSAANPTYGPVIDMGHMVRASLSITTASASIPGDDVIQVEVEEFFSGQIEVETTMSDLDVNSKLYGHQYTENGGEISSSGDSSPNGAYAFVQVILTKEKKRIYRATFLHKVTAMAGSEKQNAATKTPGSLTFANNTVSFKVLTNALGVWRSRNDFEKLDEAVAYINSLAAAAVAS